MNTLTRSNAAVQLAKRTTLDLEFLNSVFGSTEYAVLTEAQKADMVELAVHKVNDMKPSLERNQLSLFLADQGRKIPSQCESSERSAPRESSGMDALAKQLIAEAVQSATRMPSPNLKNAGFRATLMHRRQLLILALKTADEPTAFCNVVCAIGQAEGGFEALRFVRDTGRQLLWQTSVHVARARRTQSEVEETSSGYVGDGEPTHEDSDAVQAVTEDEALDSFAEAHAWLSNVADLLPVDEDDRIRLGLEDGLEFAQRRVVDGAGEVHWTRIYDLDEAIEYQLEQNVESMKRKDGAVIAKRKDAFKALAALAA